MPLTPPPKSIWDRPPLAMLLSQVALVLLFAVIFAYTTVRLPHDRGLLMLSGGATVMFSVLALGAWTQRRRASNATERP